MRKKLVYDSGKLKPGVSRVWLTVIQWDRIKTGGDGSKSEDDLRQRCEGTLIEFLDQASIAYASLGASTMATWHLWSSGGCTAWRRMRVR